MERLVASVRFTVLTIAQPMNKGGPPRLRSKSDNTLTSFFRSLKEKREALGYSIRQLAKQTGVSFSTLARLERGIGKPDPLTRKRLEEWMRVDRTFAPILRASRHPTSQELLERRVAFLERELAEVKKYLGR